MAAARKPPSRYRRFVRELQGLIIVALLVFAARSSLADHYRVPSGSMLPTVEIGDRILVTKAAYGLRVPFTAVRLVDFAGPQRGDVVVLDSPEDDKVLLKRVVAVPGDEVMVREGLVYIDGVVTEASPPLLRTHGGGPDLDSVLVPPDSYLVMGDNRGDSHDGRMFGLVSRDAILGRAAVVYFRDGGFAWEGL